MAVRTYIISRAEKTGFDHNQQVGNKILLGFQRTSCKDLVPKMELVELALHQVLYEAEATIEQCYFINSGLISVVSVQPNQKSVEVGLIGREGFVGLPIVVGYTSSPTRAVVQGDGAAYRCDVTTLRQLLRNSPQLGVQLNRYSHQLALQTTQIAVCNRLHEVEECLARWILMCHDRLLRDKLPLTQQFLSQMLGTRRATVTVAAGILQKAGLISYTRGSVTILDRPGLESAACDCYAIVQRQLRQWDNQTNNKKSAAIVD